METDTWPHRDTKLHNWQIANWQISYRVACVKNIVIGDMLKCLNGRGWVLMLGCSPFSSPPADSWQYNTQGLTQYNWLNTATICTVQQKLMRNPLEAAITTGLRLASEGMLTLQHLDNYNIQNHKSISDICNFQYATTLFRPVKSTPKSAFVVIKIAYRKKG